MTNKPSTKPKKPTMPDFGFKKSPKATKGLKGVASRYGSA